MKDRQLKKPDITKVATLTEGWWNKKLEYLKFRSLETHGPQRHRSLGLGCSLADADVDTVGLGFWLLRRDCLVADVVVFYVCVYRTRVYIYIYIFLYNRYFFGIISK